MSRLTWRYHGEIGVMLLDDPEGGTPLRLPVSIPDAHALARFIEARERAAARTATDKLIKEINRLSGSAPEERK